jgi:dienelactone hydrolase
VLIQEWWGVNDQIRGVARRLADAGYGVLIPDLYRGKLAGDGDEANHLMSDLNFPDAVHQDLVGASATPVVTTPRSPSWASAWAAPSPSPPPRTSPR